MSDPKSFRERLEGDLDARYDKLIGVIDDALESKQQVWVSCPSCKKRAQVEVQDVRAAIAAAEFVTAQALGRPGIDDQGAGAEEERIIFERVVYMGNDEEIARLVAVAEGFIPAEQLEAFKSAVRLTEAAAA